MKNIKDSVRMTLRIPKNIHDSIILSAKQSNRSINGEIVNQLTKSSTKTADDDTDSLLLNKGLSENESSRITTIRISESMLAAIKKSAGLSGRSMNGEIVELLTKALNTTETSVTLSNVEAMLKKISQNNMDKMDTEKATQECNEKIQKAISEALEMHHRAVQEAVKQATNKILKKYSKPI